MNRNTILTLSLVSALAAIDPGVRRQVERTKPKPQRAPDNISARQAKRQAKLARRAAKHKADNGALD